MQSFTNKDQKKKKKNQNKKKTKNKKIFFIFYLILGWLGFFVVEVRAFTVVVLKILAFST